MTNYRIQKAKNLIRIEKEHGAFNYAPMPVVLTRGEGARVSSLKR